MSMSMFTRDLLHTIHGLSDDHFIELNQGSAIKDLRIRQRYYQSVKAADVPNDFADYQKRDGLLFPIRSVNNTIESWQLKPDNPRMGKNGKPIKYETAANCRQIIDVPSPAFSKLGDPNIPLVITEGAKKVDAGISAGIECIIGLQGVYGWRGTNEHGGKTALPDWEKIALNGRNVLLAFDSDVMNKESVRDALERLANFLKSKGAQVGYLLMPHLPDGSKCGLDDWFANGNTFEELQKHMHQHLPPLTTLASPVPTESGSAKLNVRYMNEIEYREIDWLWPSWLPKGMLSLIGGYAGDGKSTITLALAAALSNGDPLPDGTTAPITKTLLVLTEDDVSTVAKSRLNVHNAKEDRVLVMDDITNPDGTKRAFNLKTDILALREMVLAHDIGLIIIDPIVSIMANGDRNNDGEVRDTMAPLIKLMEETGVSTLGIMHIGKNEGRSRSMQNLMGSTAWIALARAVWMVNQLPEDFQEPGEPTRKVMGVTKSNYAVIPESLQFSRALDAPLRFHGLSPISIEDSFHWKKKAAKEESGPTETEKAEDWLVEFMGGQRKLASEVESAAKAEGFTWATINKAKKRLQLSSQREGKIWYWLPPEGDAIDAA